MALIGNYSVLLKGPGRFFSGAVAQNRSNWSTSGSVRGRYVGGSPFPQNSGVPNGYQPPGSWMIPQKGGSLASTNNISGSGALSISSLSLGKALAADLAGSGTISSASLSMLIQLAADLLGSCSITADLKAITNMTASLAGTSSITASLSVIAFCVASLNGSGSVSGTFTGLANMSADITPFTELSPQNLATAVWEALAADFNTVGTMGEKLNDAGAAGNPWAALLADNNDAGTFGERVQKLLTLAKYLGLK